MGYANSSATRITRFAGSSNKRTPRVQNSVHAAARYSWMKAVGCQSERPSCKSVFFGAGAELLVPRVSFPGPMPAFAYRYELRRGEEVISTGHLSRRRRSRWASGWRSVARSESCVGSSRCWGSGSFGSSCSSGARTSTRRHVSADVTLSLAGKSAEVAVARRDLLAGFVISVGLAVVANGAGAAVSSSTTATASSDSAGDIQLASAARDGTPGAGQAAFPAWSRFLLIACAVATRSAACSANKDSPHSKPAIFAPRTQGMSSHRRLAARLTRRRRVRATRASNKANRTIRPTPAVESRNQVSGPHRPSLRHARPWKRLSPRPMEDAEARRRLEIDDRDHWRLPMTSLATSASATRLASPAPRAERPLRILFLVSAHNSLSQRVFVALTDLGHDVSVEVVDSSAAIEAAVARHTPELIVCPMLKSIIPESVWSQTSLPDRAPGPQGRPRAVLARLGDRARDGGVGGDGAGGDRRGRRRRRLGVANVPHARSGEEQPVPP